ncbi:MarR family winged helix-turn-helix transcriptional regulator [Dermatobacter hominis]|uniref:MarR family winged helix-turn-helix transcriptional regulator n=1 Tax=Dermatobacter hominis TaxID=2884263 RepID=UPI001D0F6C86|nr:MarR family winged helix-turn-helix transcriptional regulator [Dermatobacter hominis]UDY34945.1 MarR family winged helix-turn-helix transcriptional regulator [Dermatobacter hominis]
MAPEPTRDADEIAAWLALVEAQGYLYSVLDRELQEACGLELAKYEVLAHLADQPDWRLRMSDLAARCGLSPSGITRRLDPMERDKLLKRETAPGDRRGVVAVLTKKGYSKLLRAAPVHIAGVRQHVLDILDEDELVLVFKALNRVVESIRQDDVAL